MDRWFGRVALVTGASSGIGEATARLLAHCGMKVVGCARRLEKLQQIASDLTSAPGKFLPIKCDVTNEKETLAMFARIKSEWGGVDVCVNNAGTIRDAPLSSGDTAHWRLMLDSVSPGCVETEILMYVYPNQPEELQQIYHGGRRRMDPKDIADAVVYALSCPPHVQVHEMIVRATEDE